MKRQVTVGTPAKINLSLDIVGKRPDGYHLIESVMQSIKLSDTLKISVLFSPEAAQSINIVIKCDSKDIPCDEKNTIYKAGQRFIKEVKGKNILNKGFLHEIFFDLSKNIPHEAGLAGGSSNAAGALFGLNHICDGIISKEKLLKMAVGIGADVSFCLVGGTAFCTGIGHIVKPLEYIGDYPVLLIKPDFGISTAKAYMAIDSKEFDLVESLPVKGQKVSFNDITTAKNVFEQYAIGVYPKIKSLIDRLKGYRGVIKAAMTGSGPTVYAVFEDDISAKTAYNEITKDKEFFSYIILLSTTSSCGPYIINTDGND